VLTFNQIFLAISLYFLTANAINHPVKNRKIIKKKALLMEIAEKVLKIVTALITVYWNSRMLAFRGAGGEPPRRLRLRGLTCSASPAGVSHLPFQSTGTSIKTGLHNNKDYFFSSLLLMLIIDFCYSRLLSAGLPRSFLGVICLQESSDFQSSEY
jgi:hypothetical protein